LLTQIYLSTAKNYITLIYPLKLALGNPIGFSLIKLQ